jgi:oligoribonuclease NrnB/cAMP/cGMP phosphodiesterase (DHH superfamily)
MHVVYCSPQLDGLAAAAILFRAARLRGAEARLGGTLTFENAREQFTAMTAHHGDLLFILDFLPDSLAAFEPLLTAITQRNRIAYWNSHHPHDAAAEEFLRRFAHTVDLSGPLHYAPVPKEKTCAAELSHNRFLPTDAVAKELAQLAHDIEFWERNDQRAVQLADLIASGFDAKELVDSLSRGVFWSERFEQLRQGYLTKKQNALQDIMKHLMVKNILNYRFGFTLAPTLLSTADAGQHILDNHAGVDISVVLYRNGRISFRKRNTCPVNLAELAKLFGGGGHSYAAGARLTRFPSITREHFDSVIFALDQQLKAHLLS